jgi:hypothetical protein
MRLTHLAAISTAIAFSLSACSTQSVVPAGTSPAALAESLLPTPIKTLTTADLTQTAADFDVDLAQGYTQAQDFDSCAHLVNQQLGIEPTPGVTASTAKLPQVKTVGVFSFGAVGLTDIWEAQSAAQTGLTIPGNCILAIGQIHAMAMGQIFGVKVNITAPITSAQLKAMVTPPAASTAGPAIATSPSAPVSGN